MDIYSLIFNYTINTNNREDFVNIFKLPIEYLENKTEINDNIINDLELKQYRNNDHDISSIHFEFDISNNINNNLYYNLFNPKDVFSKSVSDRWCNYYTTDKDFLLESQKLLQSFKPSVTIIDNNLKEDKNKMCEYKSESEIYNLCENIFYDNGFIEKYQYIDLPFFNKYNNNVSILQALSIYNIASPIFNLAIPILFLLLPFFIIKLQGHRLTIDMYFKHVKNLFSQHILGQLFNNFSNASISTKIYLILSFAFYIFQTYQNIINCDRYYKNIKFIHNTLLSIREYINRSINNFRNLLKYTISLIKYENFNKTIEYNVNILSSYLNDLNNVKKYEIKFSKIFELGHIMKCFYKLHTDTNIIKALYFSYGANGYIDNIISLQKNIKSNTINYCSYITNDLSNRKTSFTNSYYGKLIQDFSNSNIIKNSYKLDDSLILTGPNAAGKTTLLKSTIFNILLSQQVGCGFFEKAEIKIYDYIHCYINIPDTSGRDSLFQAEARRCKEILSIIENNKNKTHLCVFDELFSGTNPDEAISSGYSYLNYLNNLNNVNYVLTTHYYKLCKKLKGEKSKNYHMQIEKNKETDDLKFTYKLKKGISKIKGGTQVLKNLNYPTKIINTIECL